MALSTAVVNWLRRDIQNGNTPTVAFCGRQRGGKTAFAMRCAYELYPNSFDSMHMVNSIEEFAKAMLKFTHSVIVLDEASVSLYIYDWASFYHKIFSIIQDTQAFKHNTVFIVAPYLYALGKLHKYSVDAIITLSKKKVLNETNGRIEKLHAYKFKIHHKQYDNFEVKKVITTFVGEFVGIPLPPPEIWGPYISKGQQEFKEKILNAQLEEISRRTTIKLKEEAIHN